MEKIPDKELAKVMAWLSEKMRCPLCEYQYNLERTRVLPRQGSGSQDVTVHTICGRCRSCLLFALDIRGGEVFLVGVVTDLTYSDSLRFQAMEPISTDDLIDWHNFWATFDGDIIKALT